jgi:hypothetical protein
MRARADTASEAGLLASAVALRWSRPDLTAALAEHVGEASMGDDSTWVVSAGWLVHGRAATGDGRECASDALGEIARRGQGLLDDPAADRLRIEVAMLAAGQCEPAIARLLVAPLLETDKSAEVRADALGVLARCVMEERPVAIGEATRRAEVAWAEIGGRDAAMAGVALALLSAAALRRSGHPDSAVDRAAEGLARLDGLRAAQEGLPSRHLAAALGAEWITALIEAGRTDDARKGCAPMVQQLQEATRPTRQIALLRLAVARALAESTSMGAVEALEHAARDAADCDAPDLEGLCLSTLGALREQSGRLDAALESMRRGVAAQRRDRARSERFRAALGAMSLGSPWARAGAVVLPDRQALAAANPARTHVGSNPTTAERNLVEPVHPLAGGGEIDPWSTGRWANQRTAAADPEGRRRRGSPERTEAEDLAADGLGDFDVAEHGGPAEARPTDPDAAGAAGAAGAADAEHVADWAALEPEGSVVGSADLSDADLSDPASGLVDATAEPILGNGGIEDLPVAHNEHASNPTYDGERWLEAALAELDRVWGQPLPDLDGHVVLPAEPPITPTAVESSSNGYAADSVAGDHLAIGCVVVIDVVRGGAPVPDGGEVLRPAGDRLNQRIPAGARLRFDVDESAMSVVLPGRERSAATEWMHQTLPAVFADMADLCAPGRWATGTTLRATMHDTDGPVGAQLVQRLDVVAPRPPVPRAQRDVSPPEVVRWGVPILAGSGGRRRRPDDTPDPVHPDPVHPDPVHPDPVHPDAVHPDADRPEVDQPTVELPTVELPTVDQLGRDESAQAVEEGLGLSYWDSWDSPRQGVDPPPAPASETPGRHRETGPSEPASAQRQADAVAPTAADDSAFSVEGLGLADLLAGALAAYRGI